MLRLADGKFKRSFAEVEVFLRRILHNCKAPPISVQFREVGQLLDLDVLQGDRDAPIARNQVAKLALFLGPASQAPETISCDGVCVDVITSFDRCLSAKLAFFISTLSMSSP